MSAGIVMKSSLASLGVVLILATATATAGVQARVPLIEDPPPPRVPLIEDADDLLPVVPGRKPPPPTRRTEVPRLDEPPPPDAGKPAPPAARANIGDKAGGGHVPIGGSFRYDLVLGFFGGGADTDLVTSYFYLDSKNGHFGMDRGAIESLGNAPASGEGGRFDFQVFTRAADHYLYVTSTEMGPVAMKASGGQDALGADLAAYLDGEHFESTFRRTGKTRDIGLGLSGQPYPSEEYVGNSPETGAPMSIWLARPDFEPGFYAATYFGLGIVPLPGANRQRLVTRIEGEGVVFELSYLKRADKAFSGAGYRDLSGLVPGMMP